MSKGIFGDMPRFEPGPPWCAPRAAPALAEGASSCPTDPPPPAGYRVWTGPVPSELAQWAIDLLRTINQYDYGTTWTIAYQGATVLARKDHHTWTWRGGTLVTGLCIPGITLYTPAPPAAVGESLGHFDVAQFTADQAASLSWWKLLAIGAVAGVVADELVRFLGRRA